MNLTATTWWLHNAVAKVDAERVARDYGNLKRNSITAANDIDIPYIQCAMQTDSERLRASIQRTA
jgi:hypothetical protein